MSSVAWQRLRLMQRTRRGGTDIVQVKVRPDLWRVLPDLDEHPPHLRVSMVKLNKTPHFGVSRKTLRIARKYLIPPKESADFAYLASLPNCHGNALTTRRGDELIVGLVFIDSPIHGIAGKSRNGRLMEATTIL